MEHCHPERAKGFDYRGFHRYLLTFCTHQRAPVFISTASVELVLSQISRAAHEERLALLAYWFMPDHLHLLIRGECEASDCKAFIKRAKQYSGFYYSKAFGQKLWQRYGHDHVLRDSERTGDVVRYILENPVKAGLCARADDYPFSGGYR